MAPDTQLPNPGVSQGTRPGLRGFFSWSSLPGCHRRWEMGISGKGPEKGPEKGWDSQV